MIELLRASFLLIGMLLDQIYNIETKCGNFIEEIYIVFACLRFRVCPFSISVGIFLYNCPSKNHSYSYSHGNISMVFWGSFHIWEKWEAEHFHVFAVIVLRKFSFSKTWFGI